MEFKKDDIAIILSGKIDLKTKTLIRNKEGHYVMIKGSILQEDITIFSVHLPNMGVKISEGNTHRTARRHRNIHYYTQRLQPPHWK